MKKNQTAKTKLKKRPPKKKAATKKADNHDTELDDFFATEPAKKSADGGMDFEMLGFMADFPKVDRLALISALILKEGKISEAVRTALDIYDCCHVWLRDADMERQYHMYHAHRDDDYLEKNKYSFTEAVKIITNQKRLDRAIEYFSDYGMYAIAKDASYKTPADRLKRFEERTEFRKLEGFTAEEVRTIRQNFRNYFPKRRKKSLDLQNSI